jgi:ribosomal protein S18 acetylase RimI-like enzyme
VTAVVGARSGARSPARIRRGAPADWVAAQRLVHEVEDLHATIAPDYFRTAARGQDDWLRLIEEAHTAVFVAEAVAAEPSAGARAELALQRRESPTTEVVGVLVARVYDTPMDPTMVPRRRSHVETLVVGARHRRRGIGRLLMSESTAWARAQGAVEVVLTTWAGNEAADAFYERLGYRVLSRVLHARLD